MRLNPFCLRPLGSISRQGFIMADFALSADPVPTFTIAPASVSSPLLEKQPCSIIIIDDESLSNLLECAYNAQLNEDHTIVVIDASGTQFPVLSNVE